MKSSAELIQAQVDAYNARDLEAFLAAYAESVVLLKDGREQTLDKAVLRERYGKLFRENPDLKCEIRSREVAGDAVIDEEHVTGFADGVVRRVRARYELADGLINRVSFTALPG